MSAPGPLFHRLRIAGMLLALALWLGGCADRQAEPARQAIADVEAALQAAGTEPVKYIPGEVGQVRTGLDSLKQRFADEDYGGVLREAPAVLAAARALAGEAAAREVELRQSLQKEWAALEPVVPARIEEMRSAVEAIAVRRSLPGGVSRDDVAKVGRRVDDAQVLWDRARAERDAGRLPEAVTLANQARELLDLAARTVGLAAPVDPVK